MDLQTLLHNGTRYCIDGIHGKVLNGFFTCRVSHVCKTGCSENDANIEQIEKTKRVLEKQYNTQLTFMPRERLKSSII